MAYTGWAIYGLYRLIGIGAELSYLRWLSGKATKVTTIPWYKWAWWVSSDKILGEELLHQDRILDVIVALTMYYEGHGEDNEDYDYPWARRRRILSYFSAFFIGLDILPRLVVTVMALCGCGDAREAYPRMVSASETHSLMKLSNFHGFKGVYTPDTSTMSGTYNTANVL